MHKKSLTAAVVALTFGLSALADFQFGTTVPPDYTPGGSITVGIQVSVPQDAGWDVTDVLTLTASSQADPGVTAEAVFTTKTPSPILLVDDHRWYDTSERYRNALEARHLD